MKALAFPFRIDETGRTARVQPGREVRELVEQLLFTTPGERVMRPTLGTGAAQLVFAAAGADLALSTQHLVQGAIQTWLGDLVSVEGVEVEAEEGTLTVTIRTRSRATGEIAAETIVGTV